jgi:hypothetical protein
MSSDSGKLIGTWKLASCFMEDVETKEQKPVWGEHPNGYIVLTSGGRWIVVQTAQGRKAPQTDEDRTAAFCSMLSYSGKYHTEGNKIVIKVDIAWDESWNGTEQVRYYRIEGDPPTYRGRTAALCQFWRQGNARHPDLDKRLSGVRRDRMAAMGRSRHFRDVRG